MQLSVFIEFQKNSNFYFKKLRFINFVDKMMSHGRGRGMRPAAENNGSVGGEAGSTTGSDADSKSQDDR